MSNELSQSVDSYITRILPQARKELKYVKDNDWSKIENVKTRDNSYKVQKLLVDRNIGSAIKIYRMAGEDLDSKRVKAALKLLISFFSIVNKRYKKTIELFDWTSFDLEDDKTASKAKAEVEFQSVVLTDVNSLEEKLRAINFGDESDDIHISFFGETKAPFMMRDNIEAMFPEVVKYLEKKNKK